MSASTPVPAKKPPLWQRLAPWLITVLCFGYLYTRLGRAAGPDQGVAGYLASVFASVDWASWLLLMVCYSLFFLLIDTLVLWRVINWFNARISLADLIPVRASTYIISIVNEQVGKGAIALYLNRREGVPGWQLGSSMFFIMICEFYYLMIWATIGITLQWNALPEQLHIFRTIPWIALGAGVIAVAWLVAFRSERFAGPWRDRHLFHAFRQAKPWQYLGIMLLRSPALLAGVFVYSTAAGMFGVEISYREMLGYYPVVIFGTLIPGPFRAVAVTMWATLFPEHAGEMTVFGFVQHNFFVLFNAAIGLVFLRRANRELLAADAHPGEDA